MSGKMAEKPKDKYDPHPIGRGKLKWDKDVPKYIGSFPFYQGEEDVALIRTKDLVSLVDNARALMFQKYHFDMPQIIINSMPDCFEFTPTRDGKEEETINLLLERRIYTDDPSREMWVRYISVDEALKEEDWTNTDRNEQ